ncbi:hypothetical protein EMCRGX_G005179 [Ephydatia muelleri]
MALLQTEIISGVLLQCLQKVRPEIQQLSLMMMAKFWGLLVAQQLWQHHHMMTWRSWKRKRKSWKRKRKSWKRKGAAGKGAADEFCSVRGDTETAD